MMAREATVTAIVMAMIGFGWSTTSFEGWIIKSAKLKTLRPENGRGTDHPDLVTQFHFRPFSCCRLTLPPLSTQTTLEPAGALISPLRTAATDAAAAPSTTSLQCDMIQ